MGVLADFFVATEEDAAGYEGASTFPPTHRAQYKRFTELELGTLYHITQGMEVDDDTFYEFRVVGEADDGERVITAVLPDLVSRLAGASDSILASWADKWGATEEINSTGSTVLPVLEDLRRLSLLAVSESKGLYLWNCT